MRKILNVLLIIGIVFGLSQGIVLAQDKETQGTLTLSGAWAIYPTVVSWAEAFQKLHPNVKIDVSAGGAGKGAADAIAGLVDIGMVSREPDPSEIKQGITPVYILHDAIFAVVSGENPILDELLKKGVKKEILTGIYITGLLTKWDQVVGRDVSLSVGKAGKPIHVYTRSDSCGAAGSWAGYFGKKQDDLKGIGIYGDPGLLEVAKKDPLGIGFNNFSYVFTREGSVVKGARLVPIDANGNGQADSYEIFTNRADAVAAIEAGKYPVTRKNYFFVKGKPKGLVLEFIQFVLSDEGTKVVNDVAASLPLPKEEREKVLLSLVGI